MGKDLKLDGQRFGKLLVLAECPVRHKGKGVMWTCICDCGTRCKVASGHLTSSNVKSCGCLVEEIRSEDGESGFVRLWHNYLHNGLKRNHYLYLTEEEFRVLVIQDCQYCGKPPSMTMRITAKKNNDENRKRSEFPYNGIDRLDNRGHYTLENSVTACRGCNARKHMKSLARFLEDNPKQYEYVRSHRHRWLPEQLADIDFAEYELPSYLL